MYFRNGSKGNSMEKIDFVITWVDGTDPAWLQKKKEFEKERKDSLFRESQPETVRYRDWGFLPYLFRGIETYAPWVRHVYLVTDNQKPHWLDEGSGRVSVVDHRDFIPKEYLPTFNSHTIELNLHRIPGLSEQFVYFNDDVFLTKECKPEDFFMGGKPVDEAGLNGINGRDNEFARIQFSNMALMNRHYTVKDCRRNLTKWLRPSYGKNAIRTLLLLPFQRLQGIYNPHGPMPFLRETCRLLWERDGDVMDETCRCRFREGNNVSAYVYRFEQLLSGNFVPRKNQNGYYTVGDSVEDIKRGMKKYKSVCINDAGLTEEQFRGQKEKITAMLEQKFPQRSSYEKGGGR